MKRPLLVQLPVFITIRTVVNTAIRMVYPFLPLFGRGLGVDLQTLSLALTLRSVSGIFGPFLASIADSRGRKVGMLFGLLLFTSGVGLLAIQPGYPAFVLMLILSITGNLVFIPSMQAYLGDQVVYRRRGLVLALTEFGWSLSFIAGVPLAGFVIARFGWQAPFPLLAALGLLSIFFLAILLPQDRPTSQTKPGLAQNLAVVFTHPPALAGIAVAILISSSNELVNLVFGVWLEDTFSVQVAALAAASLVIGASELGGEALVSVLTDRLGKSRAVGIGLVLNCLAVLALPLSGRSLFGALVGLFLLYCSFEFTLVSSIPLMTEVLPAARATFLATYIAGMALGRALGALISPHLYELGTATGIASGLLFIALVSAGLDLSAFVCLRFLRDQ